MAIVVEEEKKSVNWFGIGVAAVIIVLAFATVYYLFMAEVPLIEKVINPGAKSIKEIGEINFEPSSVTGDPTYKSLKEHVGSIQLPVLNLRPNPFRPFR